jgi:dephospho-CoA kinase
MRSIIFGSTEKKLALEQIIHPRLAELTNNELVKSGYAKKSNQPWFYEAALIFEKKRERDFYSIWVCYCPDSVQLKRLTQRDKISISEAKAIISHQMPIEEKIKKANISIDTNCSFEELEKKILEALQSIKRN